MADAAVTDLAAGVAAHHAVILVARECHEAVRVLAMLSTKAGERPVNLRANRVGVEDCGLKENYKGAADAVGPGGTYPAPSSVCARQG